MFVPVERFYKAKKLEAISKCFSMDLRQKNFWRRASVFGVALLAHWSGCG